MNSTNNAALQQVLSRLQGVQQSGNSYISLCPGHDDHDPSLSIGAGDDGRVLLKCFAGCSTEDVLRAIGLTFQDLYPDQQQPQRSACNQQKTAGARTSGKPTGKIIAEYDYRNENGELLYQALRFDPKDFRQRKPDGQGGWSWSVKDVPKVLYRLSDMIAAKDRAVLVTEGEKDVDRLHSIGCIATCNVGGAGKWLDEYSEQLRGRTVIILPDKDEPGQKHAEKVAAALHEIAKSVRILKLPGLPEKGDVSDWIDAGGTRKKLAELHRATPEWKLPEEPREWKKPIPLGLEVPPFPVAVLPTFIRNWVLAEAIATQTPADLPAMLVLAVVAASIAKKVEVRVRAGWIEPANIYVLSLLESGNHKSAVFADATHPLREFERAEIERLEPDVRRSQSERKVLDERIKQFETNLVKVKNETERRHLQHELDALITERAESTYVARLKLLVDDCTSEKLGMILAEQGSRIASLSAEGGVFDLMAGCYSKNGLADIDLYLKGHSGEDHRTDRVSRRSVSLTRPAITMGYTIQTDVLKGLLEKPTFRGRGLLARFLYSLPESRLGTRDINPPPVPEGIAETYRRLVLALCEMPFDTDNSGETSPHYLNLSPEALGDLHRLMTMIEPELGIGGRFDCMTDWGGKLAGAVVRIAGILHSVEHPDRPWDTLISQQTMAAAIAIGRYLVPHARAAFELMGADAELEGAKKILRWIKQKRLTEFSARDAHRAMQRRIKKAEDVAACLKKLEAHNIIRDKVEAIAPGRKSSGRPSSPMFEVNPAIDDPDTLKSADKIDKTPEDDQPPEQSENSVGSVSATAKLDSG